MAVVGLGAPMAYRYYLLNVAAPARPAVLATAPAPAPTATPVVLASAPAPAPGTWEAAIAQVEEVRGSAGRVEVPDDLQHYEDRRRFLAVQMADSQDRQYRLPDDDADLAEMIQRGEVVEMPPIGDHYLLYDLGTDARDDPLVHYDPESGKDVPLFPSLAEYEAEDARLEKRRRRRRTGGREGPRAGGAARVLLRRPGAARGPLPRVPRRSPAWPRTSAAPATTWPIPPTSGGSRSGS